MGRRLRRYGICADTCSTAVPKRHTGTRRNVGFLTREQLERWRGVDLIAITFSTRHSAALHLLQLGSKAYYSLDGLVRHHIKCSTNAFGSRDMGISLSTGHVQRHTVKLVHCSGVLPTELLHAPHNTGPRRGRHRQRCCAGSPLMFVEGVAGDSTVQLEKHESTRIESTRFERSDRLSQMYFSDSRIPRDPR